MSYTEEELVSSDIDGTTQSAIIDSKVTKCRDKLAKIRAWYDNEFGYSNRLVDFVRKMGNEVIAGLLYLGYTSC